MRKWIALLWGVALIFLAAVPVLGAQAVPVPEAAVLTVSPQTVGLIALGSAAAGVAVAVILVRKCRKAE